MRVSVGFQGSWARPLLVGAASAAAAVALTRLPLPILQSTPFLFGFAAVVVSGWLGGRWAWFVAVFVSSFGYTYFPPPIAPGAVARAILGYAVVSGGAGWLVSVRFDAESELRASRQRLHAVLSSLPVVVWTIDPDGRITFVDGRGLEALQLNANDLLGRSVFDVSRGDPELLACARRVLDGETFTAESTVGSAIVETRYSPLRDRQDGIKGAVGVSIDITARRQLEEQYLQAQKMEAVGQLAAGVAHDFNNHLVTIGGYAELVSESLEPSDSRREELLEISKAAERGATLTRQLLAFSSRQVLHPRVLDLNLLVENIQKLLRRTLGEHIELVIDLSGRTAAVRADPSALEHVLINLAVNARDAMPSGGRLRFATADLEVDAESASPIAGMPPGRYVCLSAADTGTGMPPEVQARIFEPFFTTKERGKGTGLGLATAYGVVAQSGGYIGVDTGPGLGTTFRICLPAVDAAVDANPEDPRPGAAVGGSETILVAEDDSAVRRLASDVLTQWGYTVLEARDGVDALTIAGAYGNRIHLLVTDVVMPGLGGRGLALRLSEERPRLRVLYTSGYAADEMLRLGFESGVRFLPKPFLPIDLVKAVRDVLDAATFAS